MTQRRYCDFCNSQMEWILPTRRLYPVKEINGKELHLVVEVFGRAHSGADVCADCLKLAISKPDRFDEEPGVSKNGSPDVMRVEDIPR